MAVKFKTAVQYWGVIPSVCFLMVIVSQLLVVVGAIAKMAGL